MENFSPNCRHGYPAQSCLTCLPEQANFYPQPFNNVNPFAQDGYGLNSSLSGALQFQTGPTEVGRIHEKRPGLVGTVEPMPVFCAGGAQLSHPQTILQPDVVLGMWTLDQTCTYCGKLYKNKGDRDRHVREAHTHGKTYLCHVAMCRRGVEGNGFARMSQLVVHLTGGSHKMEYDAARLEAARHNHNHNHHHHQNHTGNVNVNAASNH
ncbi:hypothetical protein H2202_001033 [Exophiala xenobiotica]|nr:hypothetical protein H2202_001033 [Exophiala xenobiotica]KAK5195103.1 hypothetical protein LTR92_005233 [Exophiala xenobiotica]KAK5209686.1 hypothetical protein LTR41_004318 [Exophiala xenobiotica]KAK5225556.1 hypothetical protein LTR72_003459 [Exophiala xenobiotica]KAK5226406.1 hypothetical protein LTR47_009084 [Exophiala xenobiotica]